MNLFGFSLLPINDLLMSGWLFLSFHMCDCDMQCFEFGWLHSFEFFRCELTTITGNYLFQIHNGNTDCVDFPLLGWLLRMSSGISPPIDNKHRWLKNKCLLPRAREFDMVLSHGPSGTFRMLIGVSNSRHLFRWHSSHLVTRFSTCLSMFGYHMETIAEDRMTMASRCPSSKCR